MALWLDLIPKIHRSDNLDERFHLLDHFEDVDSFDADGVDLTRLDQLQRTYATTTTPAPAANSTTTSQRVGNSVAVRTQPPRPHNPTPLPSRPRPTSTARPTISRTSSGSTISRLLRSLFSRSRDGSVPLGVTVAVGCGLLFLNVLVFAAIFYQREKATRDVREWRKRRRADTGSSAGDDDDDDDAETDKYFDEAQDSFSETVRSGGGAGGGGGDTDSNSSLSVALCPSKVGGTSTGDDNDAHMYRTKLQQPTSHYQRTTGGVHNDVHLTTLPPQSDALQYDSVVRRGCCRRSSPCHMDSSERRAAPTILKDATRRQQQNPHCTTAVQSPPPPPPPPPPVTKSPAAAAVSVVISNHHHHPLQCYDDNPSTTV